MPVSIILQSPPQNPPVDPWRLSRIRPSIGLTKHKLRLILDVIEHFLLYYVRRPRSRSRSRDILYNTHPFDEFIVVLCSQNQLSVHFYL